MKKPEIEILRREHRLLQEDLDRNKHHLGKIAGAAEKLAKAIQLLAKPNNTDTRRS